MTIEELKKEIQRLTVKRIHARGDVRDSLEAKNAIVTAPPGSLGDREERKSILEAFRASSEALNQVESELQRAKDALAFQERLQKRPELEARVKKARAVGQELCEVAAAIQSCLEDLAEALPEMDRLSDELQQIERIADRDLRGVTGITGTLFHPTFRPSRLRLPLALALKTSQYKGLVKVPGIGQQYTEVQRNFAVAEEQAAMVMIDRLEGQLAELIGGESEYHAKVG